MILGCIAGQMAMNNRGGDYESACERDLEVTSKLE